MASRKAAEQRCLDSVSVKKARDWQNPDRVSPNNVPQRDNAQVALGLRFPQATVQPRSPHHVHPIPESLCRVSQDSHRASASRRSFDRDFHVTFPRHFRAVGNASLDVCLIQTRIIFEHFRRTGSGREQIQDQRHPYSVTADTWLSETTFRIDPDASQQFFSGHNRMLLKAHRFAKLRFARKGNSLTHAVPNSLRSYFSTGNFAAFQAWKLPGRLRTSEKPSCCSRLAARLAR